MLKELLANKEVNAISTAVRNPGIEVVLVKTKIGTS